MWLQVFCRQHQIWFPGRHWKEGGHPRQDCIILIGLELRSVTCDWSVGPRPFTQTTSTLVRPVAGCEHSFCQPDTGFMARSLCFITQPWYWRDRDNDPETVTYNMQLCCTMSAVIYAPIRISNSNGGQQLKPYPTLYILYTCTLLANTSISYANCL